MEVKLEEKDKQLKSLREKMDEKLEGKDQELAKLRGQL